MASFGWDLVRACHLDDLKSNTELAITVVHWRLLANGLTCCGLGDHFKSDEISSEVLPSGWVTPDTDGGYTLKYRSTENPSQKFIFKLIIADDQMIFSLVRVSDEKASSVTLEASDFVFGNAKNLANKNATMTKVDDELLKPILPWLSKKEDKKKDERKESQDSGSRLLIDQHRPSRPYPTAPSNVRPRFDPMYPNMPNPLGPMGGDFDLDPLGRMGPRRDPPSLPRFDPMHPNMPNPSGGGGRNFGDAMRPPDFNNDNMFG